MKRRARRPLSLGAGVVSFLTLGGCMAPTAEVVVAEHQAKSDAFMAQREAKLRVLKAKRAAQQALLDQVYAMPGERDEKFLATVDEIEVRITDIDEEISDIEKPWEYK